MRMSKQKTSHRLARISRRIVVAVALYLVAMPSMALDLVQTLPHLWISATALSLALVTAAGRPKD
jgi:hypothetical protein